MGNMDEGDRGRLQDLQWLPSVHPQPRAELNPAGESQSAWREARMQALRHEILSASGVEFVATLNLLPPTISCKREDGLPRTIANVVVARSNLLRIYEVVEDNAPISMQAGARMDKVRRDTEAVEGEVEMDMQGEGFVFMGAVKVIPVLHTLHMSSSMQHCMAI